MDAHRWRLIFISMDAHRWRLMFIMIFMLCLMLYDIIISGIKEECLLAWITGWLIGWLAG